MNTATQRQTQDCEDDIYDLLLADHGRQRGLAGGIQNTQGDTAERRRLWRVYKAELVAHASAEEQTFYAELIAHSDSQSQTQHSVAEHKVIEDIVAELDDMDMSSSGWLNRFHTLREKVEHHLDEEEEEVFPMARNIIDQQRAIEIGNDFSQRKARELKSVD